VRLKTLSSEFMQPMQVLKWTSSKNDNVKQISSISKIKWKKYIRKKPNRKENRKIRGKMIKKPDLTCINE